MDTPKEKWSIKNKYIIILPKKINQDHHLNGMVNNTLSSGCQMKVKDRITKEIWSEKFCIRIMLKLINKEILWTAKRPTPPSIYKSAKKLFKLLKLVPLIALSLLVPSTSVHMPYCQEIFCCGKKLFSCRSVTSWWP